MTIFDKINESKFYEFRKTKYNFNIFEVCLSIWFLRLQGRKAEEQRSQRLAAEYGQFRHDAERRLAEKDEEVESIRYV